MNPDNCDDCVLKQLEQEDLDTCGGRKVADGSAEDGTMYRYIASGKLNLLPVSFTGYFLKFSVKVSSHTIFNVTVETFHFHKDDQTVVPGQPSELIVLAVAVAVKTTVAMFSTKHGLMPTIAPQVTAHSHGMISETEDLLKKMFST